MNEKYRKHVIPIKYASSVRMITDENVARQEEKMFKEKKNKRGN